MHGARYRFGTVQFEPGSGLDPQLLARYVPFTAGEPFDADQLLEFRRGLVDSDYFQLIELTPRRDLAIDNVGGSLFNQVLASVTFAE